MARSRWKLCYFEFSVWRRINRLKKYKKARVVNTIYSRKSSIPDCYSFRNVFINKGSSVRRLVIDPMKVGYKFGEYAFTRKPFHYPTKKSKKKNNSLKRR